ncbi:MAG: hypothetical protein H0W68_04165 [Gemmatimonadaceae bacterium]|nr:hypothetical protein [Gemmatimonadaceae bacterium]
MAVSASISATAHAQSGTTIEVENLTPHPAWLTVYWGYERAPKSRVRGFDKRLKSTCVESGKKWNGSVPFHTPELGPQIKVHADVYIKSRACLVGTSRGVESRLNVPKGATSVKSQISSARGSYTVTFAH